MLMGSVNGAIDVLEERRPPLGAATIVPGHGDGLRSGGSSTTCSATCASSSTWPDAAWTPGSPRWRRPARPTSGQYAASSTRERIVGNLHRAYAELAATDGAKLDSPRPS